MKETNRVMSFQINRLPRVIKICQLRPSEKEAITEADDVPRSMAAKSEVEIFCPHKNPCDKDRNGSALDKHRKERQYKQNIMTERTWTCMCGAFEGKVTGDPALAVWCHCEQCRKQTGAAMQLGIFPNMEVIKGDDGLIKYEGSKGVFRNSCSKCGSFCYKVLGDGAKVAPLGALSGDTVKPTCHIFVKDKGNQDVMFSDLPQHDAFP